MTADMISIKRHIKFACVLVLVIYLGFHQLILFSQLCLAHNLMEASVIKTMTFMTWMTEICSK